METKNWKWFKYNEIFEIKKGKRLTKADMINGDIPYIGATDSNNGITAKKRLSIYTNAESLPNTNYNLYTDGSLYANSGTFGSVNLGSGDLNFKGADPGDIAWYDADNKEKGRIYYDGTALALRHDAGTTYKILHTGNAYISNFLYFYEKEL